ncbi:hypothetical protein D9613_012552 [Agrocybe pediades]|uniref:Uncharacterized protein n=1 Tax=Agrocybe pediades TaxID=84607 RepID=A0A8H4VMT2_9AGAR|nr:hypothetical protein D9613_012552 [Agrocybe pediades]
MRFPDDVRHECSRSFPRLASSLRNPTLGHLSAPSNARTMLPRPRLASSVDREPAPDAGRSFPTTEKRQGASGRNAVPTLPSVTLLVDDGYTCGTNVYGPYGYTDESDLDIFGIKDESERVGIHHSVE